MRTLTIALLLLGICLQTAFAAPSAATKPCQDQPLPKPTDYHVTELGANHQVWQREVYERAPDGRIVTRSASHRCLKRAAVGGGWVQKKC